MGRMNNVFEKRISLVKHGVLNLSFGLFRHEIRKERFANCADIVEREGSCDYSWGPIYKI
jgi:hypothetical protein